ncbi:hydroxyacid dehydrogenase [Ammoniphilus resinae]|uniref:D-3-phosphoglycerate dehydrogenase n=1 Tax=Ammoniphilus resinae TaxID=861532 RepID=A0ABS4GNR7_9BACL|nr:D-3-phosphoglycerate dehydrogenase [Ammoniphilus resinae]
MKKVIYIPQDIIDDAKDFLIQRGYLLKFGTGMDQATLIAEAEECDAILVRTAEISEQVITAAKQLKIIAKHGVGLDNIDVQAATARGITVTNAPLANANSVAEHVMALILGLSKNLRATDQELRKGNFEIRNQLIGMDLEGKILGIAGLGRIGRLVAKKASAGFGMKVIGYDPYMKSSFPSEVEKVDHWEQLFRASDIVSLHLPLSKETKGIVGWQEFSWMKPSALFINASRGEVVREEDLVEALRSGQIKGAGLDVFEVEPPLDDNPLFALENVLVTPHNAALTEQGRRKMAFHAAMEIDRVLSGEQPEWPVNHPLNR